MAFYIFVLCNFRFIPENVLIGLHSIEQFSATWSGRDFECKKRHNDE